VTNNFKETSWKQSRDIALRGERIGIVEVCYLEEKPVTDEGPFLKEERELLNAIAKELEEIFERKRTEQKAQAEHSFREAMEDSVALAIKKGIVTK
jgi:GAF domain-containing protein